jgi:hypothetical protein
MGYPFFSWYPLHSMSPRIEIINFGEDLSDLQVTPKRDVVDSFSLMGGRSRELLRPWVEVRVVLDRFTDRKLFRQLSAMINHLERGGSVAFGNDHQKIWMARTERISQGATSVLHGSNVGGGYYDGSTPVLSTLSSPDEIVIETGAPLAKREYHTVSSASASQINLGESLDTFDSYPTGSIVRYSDFYPTLIMPPNEVGGAHLTHDHRITYTLDINLAYVIPVVTGDSNDQPNGGDQPDWAN